MKTLRSPDSSHGSGSAAARVARRACRWLECGVRLVVEFAVPDACVLCGAGTAGVVPHEGVPAALAGLAGLTRVRLLGPISVLNRPLCPECLGRFRPSEGRVRRIGAFGVFGTNAWARTADDEVFVCGGVDGAGRIPPRPLDVRAPFLTNDAVLAFVHLVKFGGRRSLVPLAAAAMAGSIAPVGSRSVLVPVPMHPGARRRRGFNQARLLASAISRLTSLPVAGNAVVKSRPTRRQSLTDRTGRAANVRGAFRPASGRRLAGLNAILIDDLVTTGATAAACAAAALAAGAASVSVSCLARSA